MKCSQSIPASYHLIFYRELLGQLRLSSNQISVHNSGFVIQLRERGASMCSDNGKEVEILYLEIDVRLGQLLEELFFQVKELKVINMDLC